MPQRLLRPGIRQSKRWNRVGYFEQSLYVRLMTLVDDFGRYEADAELIRSETFPFGDPDGNIIPVPTIDSGLLTLASKNMLVLYEHEDKRYLQLTRWKERARSESKWPKPEDSKMLTNDSRCQQMFASPPQPSPQPKPSPSPSEHFPEVVVEPSLQSKSPLVGQDGVLFFKKETSVLFARKESDPWSYAEEQAMCLVLKRPNWRSELAELSAYRKKIPSDRLNFDFPSTMRKLLEDWGGAVDKSRRASVAAPRKKFDGSFAP